MIAAIYARVSTVDQNCGMQLTELRAFAARMSWSLVEYIETASGKAGAKRPQLGCLLSDAKLRQFDIVLVWKIDRFGRSLQHFISNIQLLDAAGIRFIAPSQNIDTDTKSPIGKLLMNIMAAFAEFERDLIIERVKSGVVEYSRAFTRGEVGKSRHSKSGKDLRQGRPAKVFRRDLIPQLRGEGLSWREIAKRLQVPLATVYQATKAA